MPTSLELRTFVHKGIYMIECQWEFDETNVDTKFDAIFDFVEPIKDKKFVVMDLGGVDYVNSKFIGYIADMSNRLEEHGGKLLLADTWRIRDTLEICGLHQIIELYDDQKAAQQHLLSEYGDILQQKEEAVTKAQEEAEKASYTEQVSADQFFWGSEQTAPAPEGEPLPQDTVDTGMSVDTVSPIPEAPDLSSAEVKEEAVPVQDMVGADSIQPQADSESLSHESDPAPEMPTEPGLSWSSELFSQEAPVSEEPQEQLEATSSDLFGEENEQTPEQPETTSESSDVFEPSSNLFDSTEEAAPEATPEPSSDLFGASSEAPAPVPEEKETPQAEEGSPTDFFGVGEPEPEPTPTQQEVPSQEPQKSEQPPSADLFGSSESDESSEQVVEQAPQEPASEMLGGQMEASETAQEESLEPQEAPEVDILGSDTSEQEISDELPAEVEAKESPDAQVSASEEVPFIADDISESQEEAQPKEVTASIEEEEETGPSREEQVANLDSRLAEIHDQINQLQEEWRLLFQQKQDLSAPSNPETWASLI